MVPSQDAWQYNRGKEGRTLFFSLSRRLMRPAVTASFSKSPSCKKPKVRCKCRFMCTPCPGLSTSAVQQVTFTTLSRTNFPLELTTSAALMGK